MKLYLYINGLCDPVRKVGVARQFGSSKDIDAYLNLFCASIKAEALKNWRCFITNDEVEFTEVDHYVLMGEPLGVTNRIKEIDLYAVAGVVNRQFQEAEKRKAAAAERAKKIAEERPRLPTT